MELVFWGSVVIFIYFFFRAIWRPPGAACGWQVFLRLVGTLGASGAWCFGEVFGPGPCGLTLALETNKQQTITKRANKQTNARNK